MAQKEVELTICCDEDLRLAYDDIRGEFMAICKKCGTHFFFESKVSLLTSEDGTFGFMRLGTYIGGSGAVSLNLGAEAEG